MERDIQEIAYKYVTPTLDMVDHETGDRIRTFLFTEENLLKFVKEIRNE